MTSSVTSTAKNSVVINTNENNASTLPAKFEACSGKTGSGDCDCTVLVCSLRRQILVRGLARAAVFAPPENGESQSHAEQRHDPTHADDRQDRGAVPRLGRVVLIAEKQNVVH